MESVDRERAGLIARGWRWPWGLIEKFRDKVVEAARKAKKLGQEDPRRIIHSLKVGLAITLVSLIYYFNPAYGDFGVSTMWAVLTVVVVFEFSVGATLGRGLNRGLATLLAGALAVGAHYLAHLPGRPAQPIILGIFVFLVAAALSFLRFFPKLKARYDYALLIFILTFSLVSVTGYRDEEVLELAQQRLSTVLIGCATAMLVSIGICPVWAGYDLHKLVAGNVEKLGNFLEGFSEEYVRVLDDGESKDNKTVLQGYKSILTSKNTEDSLANFARWEPGHGRFRFRHPWKQYQKIGSLAAQCAYRIEALSSYPHSHIQAPTEIQSKIQAACTNMSTESGKALKELASAIKSMTKPCSVDPHIVNSKIAAESLKSLLETHFCEDVDLLELMPTAVVGSLLVEVITYVEEIAESVHELSSLAHFKDAKPEPEPEPEPKPTIEQPQQLQQTIQKFSGMDGPHHIITINGSLSIKASGTVVNVTRTDVIKGSKTKSNERQMRHVVSF
ncbi:hypothetical protein AAG906_038240 [Vitis piasezkii]